ncbi:MAG: glycosyltransferase [Ilumatobacteraceae bacterium]
MRRAVRVALLAARVAAGVSAVGHIAGALGRRPPIAAVDPAVGSAGESISVVIPARDEAARIEPLLVAVVGAPGVVEVLVVDDESTDTTEAVAAMAGARVVAGRPLPAGWVGKAWALDQGLREATGEWIVALDADTRPASDLPAAIVARARVDGLDLLTVAGRFECPTAPLRWLQPALLTTLVYRTGPPGARRPGPTWRRMGNGQCFTVRRDVLLGVGGLGAVAHHTVEDVALVRTMATAGFAVGFLDAADLLTVRMFESAADARRGWGRSLALPGVDAGWRRVTGVAVVGLAQALPLLRLAARRADVLDGLLLLVRAGTLIGTARAFERRGLPYWLSPTADVVAVVTLACGALNRHTRWRGRTYRLGDVGPPSRSAGRRTTSAPR